MKTKTYDLDGAVPGARGKGVLGDGAPGDGEGFALMLVKVHYGELAADPDVVHLDGAVAARDEQLVLVDLGPGEVVLRVVRVKSGLLSHVRTRTQRTTCQKRKKIHIRLLDEDALGS